VATYFAGSLAAHAALLMILRSIPPDADNVPADLAADEDGGSHFIAISNEPSKPAPTTGSSDGGEPEHTVGMALPEGAVGAPDQHNPHPARMKSTGDVSRDQAIARAQQVGVPDLFTSDQAIAMIGNADLSTGLDELDQQGGYDGDGDGVPDGSFGKHKRGVTPGGGTIVAGDYRTINDGKPTGSDFTFGPTGDKCVANRMCAKRPVVVPTVKPGRPIIDDDTVGPIVQRYMKRYKDRIGYCYERALLGNKALAGTVTASFVIGAAGNVMSSSASGVDANLDECVASVVAGIQFPRLADGGTFQVRYPFMLTQPSS
jgi:hypothetical protein